MKKLALFLLLLFIQLSVHAQGLGLATKVDSFIESDLRPLLRSAGVGGVIIGGMCLVFYLFIGDGQKAKKYLGAIGWGVLAVACLSLIISFVVGQSY